MSSINFKVEPATDDPGCWMATIKGSKTWGKASTPLLAIMRLIESIHGRNHVFAMDLQRKFNKRAKRKAKKKAKKHTINDKGLPGDQVS